MDNIDKVKIVIIDSGVSLKHSRIKNDIVNGFGIDNNQKEFIITKDIDDRIGHGTGIYGIVRNHNMDADIFVVRICDNNEQDISMTRLLYSLNYIYNNIKCNIINISLSITYYDDEETIAKLEQICNNFEKKGVIIVSAFDNNGALSYPAAFKSVIGVTSGNRCVRRTDIEFVRNETVNICGKGNMQSVISNSGYVVMGEGNSLACAHVTGIISKIYNQGMKLDNILKQLDEISLTSHDLPKSNHITNSFLKKYKKAILVTLGKEMHSIIRFQELLSFEIIGVYDVRQNGMVGKSANIELNICKDNDFIIKNIQRVDFSTFDTVIIGHITNLVNYKNVKKDLELFLLKCKEYQKNIYSLDNLNMYFNNLSLKDYYTPKVTKDNIIYAPFGKLYCISKPVIGVFGTSSVQGKFTLQLQLRKNMINSGYKVGQIGTEPTALLFGMDYCFPFGYNSSVEISRYNTIAYLNYCLHKISKNNVDVILVGCQSRTIPIENNNLEHYTLQQIEFLLATQPDVVIICVNPWDNINYIKRTISFIETAVNCKVISLAMSPMDRILDENNCYQYKKLSYRRIKEIANSIEEQTDIPIYNIGIESDIINIHNNIIEYLSE